MNYRTPEGFKKLKEATEAHHKWFMEKATPEEQDAFLDEVEALDMPEYKEERSSFLPARENKKKRK